MTTFDDNKSKHATTFWKKGTEAMSKENWDYAIEMFGKAVEFVPDNLAYRQTLRGVEYRKYGNNKSGAKMAGMKLMGIRGRIKRHRMKNEWPAVDRIAEEGLTVNPWDAHLNADMAEACKNQGFEEVAIFGYQKALEMEPDNKEYNRALAELLERRGDYSNAVKCWERIQKIDPLDGEARSKVTQLHASSMMDTGGYEKAQNTQEVQKGYEKSVTGQPQEVVGPGMSLEADLQRAIRKDPANKDNYLKLADYYKREGRLEESAAQFQKALEASGGDANIREQLEDVQLDMLRKNLDLAREALARSADDETARKNVGALGGELVQREIEILSSRVKRYDADMKLKLQLARKLMKIKKYPQAIPLLQRAANDPRLKGEVLVNLGKCFIAEKQHAMARRQFEKAIPELNYDADPEVYKESLYLLARLCEEAKDRNIAEDHYSDILAVDYEYKDVRERLERLQSAGSDDAA